MSNEITKISVKLGASEFSAEGPVAVVNAQFEAFLAALETSPPSEADAAKVQTDPGAEPIQREEIGPQLLGRVFAKDAGDRVSLKALPRSGAGDALLLLLYGFEAVAGEHSVTGSALMKAAEKSGIRLDRIDRTMAPHDHLITVAGMRRAKRYGLNNRGKQKAEEILRAVLN